MIAIAVEGETDRAIAGAMLASAGVDGFEIAVAKGTLGPSPQGLRRLAALRLSSPALVIYDQESGSVGDAVVENDHTQGAIFCPAIPTIEAWLFADSRAFFEVVGSRAEAFLGRMPLPEQLPYPKFLKSTLLRDKEIYSRLLESIDVLVAGSRSPSLKYFIQQARRLACLPPLQFERAPSQSGQISRELLRNLISEVYPSDKPLFRAASGAVVTAEQMMQEITDGTELGREYGSDILRVARDLLARQARKEGRRSL